MHTSTLTTTRAFASEGHAVTYRLLFRVFEFLLLVIVPSLEKMQQEHITEDRGLKAKYS